MEILLIINFRSGDNRQIYQGLPAPLFSSITRGMYQVPVQAYHIALGFTTSQLPLLGSVSVFFPLYISYFIVLHSAIHGYLTTEEMICHVALHIGVKDLVLCKVRYSSVPILIPYF